MRSVMMDVLQWLVNLHLLGDWSEGSWDNHVTKHILL